MIPKLLASIALIILAGYTISWLLFTAYICELTRDYYAARIYRAGALTAIPIALALLCLIFI